MKFRYNHLTLFIFLIPLTLFSQEVATFADITANGGVSVAEDGNLYVAHFGPLPPNPAIGNTLYKISPDGTVEPIPGITLSVGSGNAIDFNGFFYQSNFASGEVFKIDLTTETIVETYSGFAGPVGIVSDAGNSIYVCDCGNNTIQKISPDGTIQEFASGSFFNCANGITADYDDNIYTTNFSDGRITKITPDGTAETLGSTPVGNGHITYRHPDESLYIASYSGHQIYKMDLSGNVEPFAGTGTQGTLNSEDPKEAEFNKPNGIRFGPNYCNLYITQDDDVLRVIKFTDSFCTSSVKEDSRNSHVHVSPNPATAEIFIEKKGNGSIESVQVFDMMGKLIYSPKIMNGQMDVSALPAGLYVLKIHTNSAGIFSKKLIIE